MLYIFSYLSHFPHLGILPPVLPFPETQRLPVPFSSWFPSPTPPPKLIWYPWRIFSERLDRSKSSLKTLERIAREKKSEKTRGAERTLALQARLTSLPSLTRLFSHSLVFRLKTARFHGPTLKIRLFCSLAKRRLFTFINLCDLSFSPCNCHHFYPQQIWVQERKNYPGRNADHLMFSLMSTSIIFS